MEKTFRKAGRQAVGLLTSVGTLALPMIALASDKYTGYLDTVQDAAQLPTGNLFGIIGAAIATILTVLGVLLVLYILWAGFIWMTSQGEKDKVKKAQDMIKNAIIGLVVIFAAYAITTFVMNALTSVSDENAYTSGQ
jgi:hypothetical protein